MSDKIPDYTTMSYLQHCAMLGRELPKTTLAGRRDMVSRLIDEGMLKNMDEKELTLLIEGPDNGPD